MKNLNPIAFRPTPEHIKINNFDAYDSMFLIGYFYSQYASLGHAVEPTENERIASLHDMVRSMILAGGKESDVLDYINTLLEKVSNVVLHTTDADKLNHTLLLFTEICLMSCQLSRDSSSRALALAAIEKIALIPDFSSVIEPEILSDLATLWRAWKLSTKDPFNLPLTTLKNCGTVSASLLLGDATLAEKRITESLTECLAFEFSHLLEEGNRFLSRIRIYRSFFSGFNFFGFLYIASNCGFYIELKGEVASRFAWADCGPNETHVGAF